MLPFNRDFQDLLSGFLAAEVRFLLVGSYALAFHGHVRATKDIDVWIETSPANAAGAFGALTAFGAALSELTPEDLQDPKTVFQIDVAPRRIDIVCSVGGLEFKDAWSTRATLRLGKLAVPVVGFDELVRNKRATGRLQDLADIEALLRLHKRERG